METRNTELEECRLYVDRACASNVDGVAETIDTFGEDDGGHGAIACYLLSPEEQNTPLSRKRQLVGGIENV